MPQHGHQAPVPPYGGYPAQGAPYGQHPGPYAQPGPYAHSHGGPWQQPYGYPPKRSNTKMWVIIAALAAVLVALGIALFFVLRGDSDSGFRDGVTEVLDDLDMTKESAIDENVMSAEQYDAWFECVVTEGETMLEDSLVDRISRGDSNLTESETSSFSRLTHACLLEVTF